MNEVAIIAQTVGFLVQTVGLLTVILRTGAWKGKIESRIEALEKQTAATTDAVKKIDAEFNSVQKDLLRVTTGIQKDIEYIKQFIADEKKKGNNG